MMSNQQGFTILEILVSILIMSVGFIAFSQMQYFSIQQKYKAEIGTIATNMVQFASDADIEFAKKMHQMNSNVLLDVIATRTPDYSYCDDGGDDNMGCGGCPCNPLTAFALDPTAGTNETTCSVVAIDNFDPNLIVYGDLSTCLSDLDAATSESMVVVRAADISQSLVDTTTVQTIELTYAVKSAKQFIETPGSVTIRDTLAAQSFVITAHIDNFNESGQITNNSSAWLTVRVPHLP